MASESYEVVDDLPVSRWKWPLSWPAVLLAAWLLYEVTTEPALGIVAVCLKFGWSDFRTCYWLWRRDPDRARARACSWLYLASGLWKTAVTAVLPIFLVPFFDGLQARGQQPRPPAAPPSTQFIAALLTALAGFLLSALTTVVSLWIALRHRIRMWLHSALHQDQSGDIWPPRNVLSSTPNRLSRPLTAAIVTIVLPTFFVLILCVVLAFEGPAGQPAAQRGMDARAIVILSVVLGGMIGVPVSILAGREWLQRRVAARTPFECWPDALLQPRDPIQEDDA